MCIWRAVLGEGSELGVGPEPRVLPLKCLGLEVWRKGWWILLNYQWSELRLLNLYILDLLSVLHSC